MNRKTKHENWSSNIGVVLAVAGSAIGFGNFLRFPGLAAQYGGGAFMIAYFCAFLLMGIPLSWVEWSIGRKGGSLGGHSTASVFYLITRSSLWKYLGLAGVVVPLAISMYYIALEGWTLGYAWHTAVGDLSFADGGEYGAFFERFTGATADGSVFFGSESTLLIFFALAILANFWLLYRGVTKGIEWFSKISMPILVLTAVIILVRVLTMGTPDPTHPERNVSQGLGYMWNPDKVMLVDAADKGKVLDMVAAGATEQEQAAQLQHLQQEYPEADIQREEISLIKGLCNPDLWITAAGQIFYSLSIGFGIVCTYASYVRRRKDIALGSITANAANEVAEVGLAGMMIIPAAVSLLGVAAAAGTSTFGLGFNVLPQVFNSMPGGRFFGTLFFVLLSIGAITSAISILQPAVAYVEEFWNLRRVQSVSLVAFLLVVGSLMVVWFTGDGLIGLDTLDFWLGTMSLYFSSALYLILFRFKWGTANGLAELRSGAAMPVGRSIAFVINWVTPAIMLTIFAAWVYQNLFVEQSRHITNLMEGKPGAVFPLSWVLLVLLFFCFVSHTSRRFRKSNLEEQKEREPFS